MRHIGLSCLRSWLDGKRHFKLTDTVNSYIWKNLECEICKSPFKETNLTREGLGTSLLNYTVHEGAENYMVIESMTYTTSKTIHVVNFDASKNIRVGRAQNMEVRITDISVSRHHSTISLLEDGTLSLSDNFSKFGTLKLIQEPLEVPCFSKKSDDAVYLQVGRSMLVL